MFAKKQSSLLIGSILKSYFVETCIKVTDETGEIGCNKVELHTWNIQQPSDVYPEIQQKLTYLVLISIQIAMQDFILA